ncbi:MAG: HEAT repeat domain-containing protein [Blastocatellia bacterium]|nr:HEAT repeat domain-containing protein [Blastocatellia bacterium]
MGRMRLMGLMGLVIAALLAAFVEARGQTAMRALPLYEQCSALQGAGEAPGGIAGLKDGEAAKRAKAAEALAKSCDSRAVEPLIAALKDPEVPVRLAVAEALGRLGDRSAIDPLVEALEDSDWRVRAGIGRALASFQTQPSGNATLNVLTNPGEKQVTDEGDMRARCAGVLLVNQLRDVRFSRKAIGFLFSFIGNENPALRRIAEETALELKNTRNGYHELIGILKQHNYPDFRRKAAFYLGKFNLETARAALTEASIGDRDPTVQRAAKEALESMSKP